MSLKCQEEDFKSAGRQNVMHFLTIETNALLLVLWNVYKKFMECKPFDCKLVMHCFQPSQTALYPQHLDEAPDKSFIPAEAKLTKP